MKRSKITIMAYALLFLVIQSSTNINGAFTLRNNAQPITGGGSAGIAGRLLISNLIFYDSNKQAITNEPKTINAGSSINIPASVQFMYLNQPCKKLLSQTSSDIFPTDALTPYILANTSNLCTVAQNVVFYNAKNEAISKPISFSMCDLRAIPIPVGAISFSIDSGENKNNGGRFNLIPNKSNSITYDNKSIWLIK